MTHAASEALRPLRVGLTGGLASGKSTVARLLAAHGATVTDADALVAQLYEPGREGALAVRGLFGDEYLASSGAVDRERLAALVFADTEARRRLEAMIHPLVRQAFADLVARTQGIVVFEATLLVETGGHRQFDVLVTVEADPELRLRRAVERGLSPAAAALRLKAQASADERMAAADHVLHNEGSLADLEAAVGQLWLELEKTTAARAR